MKKLSKEAQKVVVKTRRRVVGIECDICKQIIVPSGYIKDRCRYFRVSTGHNDWGNDSCESVQDLDICPNCIANFLTEYTRNIKGTEYLGLETEYITEHEYDYDYDEQKG